MSNSSLTQVARMIISAAEAQREDLVSLCAALVAAPSVNPVGDTREVADVVSKALADRDVPARLERCDPTMPSVVAQVDSGRPGPHLVLNVHLDTMPPGDEAAWSYPVWELTRTEGRLYGLGMGNMKGAVAAMIAATAMLAEHRGLWRGMVTFTAVSDEVVFGDNGAAFLLREHPQLLGDGLICGEGPGFKRLAVGEKGVLWLELSARGEAGHSSAVRRAGSAAARIAEAVTHVDALTGLTGALPHDLAELAAATPDPGLELTVNPGVITAGTFIGQIATEARARLDVRLPPGILADEAQEHIEKTVESIESIQVTRIKGWDANWTAPASPLAQAWARASEHVTGHAPTYAIRLPASDASRWRHQGVPALCYGPQPTWSAGIDDYAEEEEVMNCASLYALAALDFLRPHPQGPTV